MSDLSTKETDIESALANAAVRDSSATLTILSHN